MHAAPVLRLTGRNPCKCREEDCENRKVPRRTGAKRRKSIEICIIPEEKVQSFYSLRRFLLDVFSGKRYNHFIRYGGTESDFSSSCIVLKGMIDMKYTVYEAQRQYRRVTIL